MKTSVFLLMISLFASASASEVKIIAFDYPPYMDGNQEAKGMVPNLITKAMKEVGLTPRFVFYPVKRAFKELQKGDSLILSTFRVLPPGNYQMLAITKARSGVFGFENNTNIKKVAYERGLHSIEKLLKDNDFNPMPVANYRAGLNMLKAGRVQGVHGVELTMHYYLEQGQIKKNITMLKDAFYTDDAGLIARPEHEEIISKILKGVKILKKSGMDKKLLLPWLTKYSKGNSELYIRKDYSIIKSDTRPK